MMALSTLAHGTLGRYNWELRFCWSVTAGQPDQAVLVIRDTLSTGHTGGIFNLAIAAGPPPLPPPPLPALPSPPKWPSEPPPPRVVGKQQQQRARSRTPPGATVVHAKIAVPKAKPKVVSKPGYFTALGSKHGPPVPGKARPERRPEVDDDRVGML